MPLVATAALSYAIGLFAACTLPPAGVVLAGVVALVVGALALTGEGDSRRQRTGLCLLLAASGAMIARAGRESGEACAHVLARAVPLHASLDDDASPGALVHAHVWSGACSAGATMIIAAGTARAADEVEVSGDATAGGRGLLVRNAIVSGGGHGAATARLRAAVGRRIDRVFREDAPLVRALVIADMSAIPAEQRDRFARAGLVHMLSVSGLHVAIVALALQLLAAALRIPRGAAGVATMLLLGGYIVLIGTPPPAVRAGVMLALVLTARLLQRPTSRWAVVALGSVIPLVDPAVVTDLGWQLSVAGTVALVAGGSLARRILPRAWRGTRRGLATAAIVSVVATAVTAPLVAWTFGRLAILGPLTNLVADPVMGVLQPVLFLALCLPFATAERGLGDAAHALIALFDGIASAAASVPFAAPAVMPSAVAACAGGVAAVALVWACLARAPARPVLLGLAALALMLLEPLVRLHRDRTELHMIDVGQGDALALRTRAGRWVVIDAGRSWPGGDAGRSTVVPYIAHRGGDVALFIMSHPHADHVGGAPSVLEALHPASFLDPGYAGASPPYLVTLATLRRDGIPWHRVHPGDSLVVDEVTITALAPDSAWAAGLADANLASAVVLVRVGGVRFLLTGDAEAAEEDWLRAHAAGRLEADVLKVAHHGSSTSTTAEFLDVVRPRVALVSVGAHNGYGHPSPEVMSALARAGAEVLRTDRIGTVVIRTDGNALEVEARGQRWEVPPRRRR